MVETGGTILRDSILMEHAVTKLLSFFEVPNMWKLMED